MTAEGGGRARERERGRVLLTARTDNAYSHALVFWGGREKGRERRGERAGECRRERERDRERGKSEGNR